MKIFVTGATGFIGAHFVNSAHEAGYEVVALRRPGSMPGVELHHEPSWVEGSLDDDLKSHLECCDAFVHLAAYGVVNNSSDWDGCLYWNVLSAFNLCKQAYEAGINKFLIAGSCFEYGKSGERYQFIPVDAPLEPTNGYAASKAAASVLLHGWAVENNLYMRIMRIFHVYGEGEAESRLWPSLRKAAIAGYDFEMTYGEQVRDFVCVKEAAKQLVDALSFGGIVAGAPRIQHVGSGHPQAVLDFASYWWMKWKATGLLKPGVIPYRNNEVMRFVPKIDSEPANEKN